VVEGRVAVLEQHGISRLREQQPHDVAACSVHRFAGKRRCVAVPAVTVVVDVDHRNVGLPCTRNRVDHPSAALAKRCEQRGGVLMVEVGQDIHDEESVTLLELNYQPAPTSCRESSAARSNMVSSFAAAARSWARMSAATRIVSASSA